MLLRTLPRVFAAAAAVLAAAGATAGTRPCEGVPGGLCLDPTDHPKFQLDLPAPAVLDATAGGHFTMDMAETEQWLGLVDEGGQPLMTRVWGYGPPGSVTYPGPTVEARRDVAVDVTWRNVLPATHLLPVDTSLHWADPATGGIPTVTHLHGGHSESASDGLPEAWFTQGWAETGPTFVKATYHYDNDQPAATLWYHDHALGVTRLNVYAGLAGFYLLRDGVEDTLVADGVLPPPAHEREIVIQDRLFTPEGELTLPTEPPELECPLPNPRFGQPGEPEHLPCDPTPGPSAVAEFFGDFILVNGVAWPRLVVEPRKTRLRLLNGSDSRFYVLELRDAAGRRHPFLRIGTDTGLAERAVALEQLVFAPGERADVVVDFAATGTVTLVNLGPDDPFKGCRRPVPRCEPGDGEGGTLPPADPESTGQVMRFEVQGAPPAQDVTVADGTPLVDLGKPLPGVRTRQLVLFEGLDHYGRLQPLLGTLEDRSLGWFEEITENPGLGETEVWEIYNATEDAHPIHLHLVAFRILERQRLNPAAFVLEEVVQPQHDGSEGVGGRLVPRNPRANPSSHFLGRPRPPEPAERGLKDTVQALPGEVTRVVATFDREGRYAWHCHILSHEDHEMMRPYCVGEATEANCGPLGAPIDGADDGP